VLSTPAAHQFWALVDGGPIQKAWFNLAVTATAFLGIHPVDSTQHQDRP